MSQLLKDRPDVQGDVPSKQDPAQQESKQRQLEAGQPRIDTGEEQENGSITNDDSEAHAPTRANRKRLTGPRSDAGRAESPKNAVEHYLFAVDISQHLAEEERERYKGYVGGIVSDLQPVGDLEFQLAHGMADILFRLELLRTAEFKIYFGSAIQTATLEGCLIKARSPMDLASLCDERLQNLFSKTSKRFWQEQKARLGMKGRPSRS
jgi:hypothetical protein